MIRASVAIAVIAVSAVSAQQPVFRARTDIVTIDVSVKDGAKTISHLTKGDFELRDRGVVQAIFDFQRERQPIDLTLTLDVSGSMSGAKQEALRRALSRISGALEPADRVEIVTFDTFVGQLAPLAPPPIAAPFRALAGGGTSVLDAVLLSLVKAPVTGRRQLDILMTDAADNDSEFDASLVRRTSEYSSTQMSFVILRGGYAPAGRRGDTFGALRAVAGTTGGSVLTIDTHEDLSDTFLAAIEEFRTSYVVRYTPTGVAPAGWHDVTVSVKNRAYTVRARRGYWGVLPEGPTKAVH